MQQHNISHLQNQKGRLAERQLLVAMEKTQLLETCSHGNIFFSRSQVIPVVFIRPRSCLSRFSQLCGLSMKTELCPVARWRCTGILPTGRWGNCKCLLFAEEEATTLCWLPVLQEQGLETDAKPNNEIRIVFFIISGARTVVLITSGIRIAWFIISSRWLWDVSTEVLSFSCNTWSRLQIHLLLSRVCRAAPAAHETHNSVTIPPQKHHHNSSSKYLAFFLSFF